MSLKVNTSIMKNIFEYKNFYAEAYELINYLMDKELEKADDEIDFEFIDSCSNALIELNLNNENAVLGFITSSKTINKTSAIGWKNINKGLRVLIVAAVIFVTTISANAAVGAFTGESVFERIEALQTLKTENSTEKETTQQTEIQTTEPTTVTQIVKDDSVGVIDDSNSVDSNSVGNDSYVVKGYQDSGNLNSGSVVSYKKKGESIKKTYVFTKKDDFNENHFLRDEYGPVGMEYCEGTDGPKHEFSSWRETKQSTCKNRGEKQRICSLCGAVQICQTPRKDKHNCILTDALDLASDYTKGRFGYECSTCGEYFVRSQPKAMQLVISQDIFYYNGKIQKPKVIAVLDENGDEISSDNYTVSYSHEKSIGVHQEYFVNVNFNLKYYNGSIGTNYFIRPMSNDIKGISSQKSGMLVFWNKNGLSNVDNTTGYEIEYSNNKSFSNSTKVKAKGLNTTSKEIMGLSSGSTYYVRMRVYYYDEVVLKNVYSTWSSTRAVDVK